MSFLIKKFIVFSTTKSQFLQFCTRQPLINDFEKSIINSIFDHQTTNNIKIKTTNKNLNIFLKNPYFKNLKTKGFKKELIKLI